MIVKLQRPIETNSLVEEVLVYNKDRTVNFMLPINRKLRKLFGPSFKIYCHARLGKDGMLEIDHVAEDQDW